MRSVILVTGLAACSPAAVGPTGADGAPGESCSVAQNDDGSATITCPDGSTATVAAVPSASCTIVDDGESRRITCPDGTSADISPEATVTCVGGFSPQSDAELLALQNCDVIDGDLTFVIASGPSTFEALRGLRRVTGTFVLIDVATPLDGLAGLEHVGFLLVQSVDHSAFSLPALATIGPSRDGSDGGLKIFDNPSLSALDLGALATIDAGASGTINVFNNPQLPQCEVDQLLERTTSTCRADAGVEPPQPVCTGNDTDGTCG